MDQGTALTLVLVAGLVLANVPFLSPRVLLLGPNRPQRAFGWRLLELLVLGALTLSLGWAFEAHMGQRHAQGWEFYVTALCLLLTFAFPGFAWRYLRRQHGD
jgi:hypothetical protein